MRHTALVARDHIVPKMLLRRFADARGHLIARQRSGDPVIPMTFERACREGGFYDIDIEPAFSQLASRYQIEKALADFEGRASRLFNRFANDQLNLSLQDRFDLMLFVAFQSVRGWAFRDEISEVATLVAKMHLEPTLTDERLRAYLRRKGRAYDEAAVDAWREELLTSPWKVVPSNSTAVAEMAKLALNVIQPDLFLNRRVRLLRFEEPTLLLSDEPVAMWVRRDRNHHGNPVGLATADALYMPVDRRHALALLLSGDEKVVDAHSKKAEVINLAVAAGAHRWIFQHPDDPPFDVTKLPPRPSWGIDGLGVIAEANKIRVQKPIVRQTHR